MEGLGLSEESKTVNGVVKPEEIGQQADEEMLEGTGFIRKSKDEAGRRATFGGPLGAKVVRLSEDSDGK